MNKINAIRLFWGIMVITYGLIAAQADDSHKTNFRGLVVGIDEYQHITDSKIYGATNDAMDIAEALSKSGAKEVRLLVNKDATRQAIIKSWHELITHSQPNDLLYFTFAGFGSTEQRLKDKQFLDEVLLLSGYSPTPPGNAERLVDNELEKLLHAAVEAGQQVVFIADASYSGLSTRDIDNRVGPIGVRALPTQTIVNDTLPNLNAPTYWPRSMDGVLSLFATRKNELAPEIIINGQPRGALSWAIASGLRGGADSNHDGQVTFQELTKFVSEAVLIQTDSEQHVAKSRALPLLMLASFVPKIFNLIGNSQTALEYGSAALEWCKSHYSSVCGSASAASIDSSKPNAESPSSTPDVPSSRSMQRVSIPPPTISTASTAATTTPSLPSMPPPASHSSPSAESKATTITPSSVSLPIRVINTPELDKALTRLQRAHQVDNGGAILTWDVDRAEVLSSLGQVVAFVNDTAYRNPPSPTATRGFSRPPPKKDSHAIKAGNLDDASRVQKVIEKWRLLEVLKSRVGNSLLMMKLEPDDQTHVAEESITFKIEGFLYPNFTLFNLCSDGAINFLYPLKNDEFADPLTVPIDKPYQLELSVTAPFGADHLISLATSNPLTELHQLLTKLEGKTITEELLNMISVQMKSNELQIGIHGSYTKPKP